jgi:hypothetical protein
MRQIELPSSAEAASESLESPSSSSADNEEEEGDKSDDAVQQAAPGGPIATRPDAATISYQLVVCSWKSISSLPIYIAIGFASTRRNVSTWWWRVLSRVPTTSYLVVGIGSSPCSSVIGPIYVVSRLSTSSYKHPSLFLHFPSPKYTTITQTRP